MASMSELKKIHDQYLDATMAIETYKVKESAFIDDAITRMLPIFNKIFMTGNCKGEMLMCLSYAPYFEWTFAASEYFSDIILGGSTDKCIAGIQKWWKNEPGCLDWSHVGEGLCELQSTGEEWPDMQKKIQRKIKQVVTYDLSQSNPLFPIVLPQADCLLLPHCLEIHVTNEEEFCSAVKNLSSLLKNGGHLIMIACVKQTYFMIGSFKFPHLSIDEILVKKALSEADYVINELQLFPRTENHLYDVADYESFILVHAQKKIPA
ncbi:nicotinamide N-methyltransferase-like [Lissotriton helveticus]